MFRLVDNAADGLARETGTAARGRVYQDRYVLLQRHSPSARPGASSTLIALVTGHAHGAASSGTTSISSLFTNSWMPSLDSSRP
jgi:hypothetical protein